jgi:multidrug efflux pump subunit AcrB
MTPAQSQNPFHALIRAFLNHRIAPNLVAVVACIAGLVALTRLNTQFFPTTDIPSITIQVNWPGASARDLMEGVLDVVEPEVRFIDGVDKVSSYAVEGTVRITLEFRDRTDMTRALNDVEARMSGITTLPLEAERPVITRLQFFESVASILVSGTADEGAIQDAAKRVRDQLLSSGVDRATFTGKRRQEIVVDLPPQVLRQLDLTPRDIADRLAVVSQNQPLGTLQGTAEATLRAEGRKPTADGVASITLRAWENGARVQIRDVAVVRESFAEGGLRVASGDNTAILINVQRAMTADTLRAMAATTRTVEAFQRSAPSNINLQLFDIQANIVSQRIELLVSNAWQGFLVVVIVLVIFLNVRVAFWVAVGVPVSLLATFAFMLATGQSINAISLVALILVLGIIVDDAIVVGEHTTTLHQQGATPHEAAEQGATRMFLPVLASTLTTQAAFLPVLLITGVVGQIIAAIPLVIVVALAASMVECFFTLPAHLKSAITAMTRPVGPLRARVRRFGQHFRGAIDRGFDWFRDGPVEAGVRLAYRWRYVTVATSLSMLIVSVGLLAGGRVGFSFFPVPEPDVVFANVTFSPGLSDRDMLAALAKVEDAARRADRELGGSDRLIIAANALLGQQSQTVRGDNLGRVELELVPGETRSVRTDPFAQRWQELIPPIVGIERLSVQGRRGGPPGSDVEVKMSGVSIETLKQAALELQDHLQSITGLVGIGDDLPFGKSEVVLSLTPRGQALGLTTDAIARQVRGAYQGIISLRFARGDEEVTLRVRIGGRERGIAGLHDTLIRTPTGVEVALSEVVTFVERPSFSVIQRRDGRLAVTVAANVIPGLNSVDAVIALLDRGKVGELRAKYGLEATFEGRAEVQRRAFRDLNLGMIVALAAIYLILAFVFQSWRQPILVMLVIPFGFIGAVFGHWIMGFDLAFLSFVALLGLSGILVNGSIVLLDRMNERLADGEPLDVAAIGSACDRLRALVLTTLTTVGGMAPLMLEKSLQAQFLIPVAITLSFGLGVATLIILFLVPAVVGIADDLKRGAIATRDFIFNRDRRFAQPAE